MVGTSHFSTENHKVTTIIEIKMALTRNQLWIFTGAGCG